MNLDTCYLDDLLLWDCAAPANPVGLTAENLGSGPDPRQASESRPQGDGSVNRTRYWGPRLVELVGYVQGADRAARTATLDGLRAAFSLREDHVLRFTPAGGTERRLAVVVASRFDAPITGDPPVIEWAVVLEAPDPRMYAAAALSVSAAPPAALAAANPGTAPVPVVLTLHGPVTDLAAITDTTTGDALAFTLPDLSGSQVLVVDTGARTVTLDGTPAPQLVDASANTWLELAPGANSLTVSGSGFTVATLLTAAYREAHL